MHIKANLVKMRGQTESYFLNLHESQTISELSWGCFRITRILSDDDYLPYRRG